MSSLGKDEINVEQGRGGGARNKKTRQNGIHRENGRAQNLKKRKHKI